MTENKVSTEMVKNIVEELVPFLKTIGLKLKSIEKDKVTLWLPKDDKILNHVGSFYAGAIFTVAEACGGAIAVMKFDITRYIIVLKSFEIRYKKPAYDDIFCTLELTDEKASEIVFYVEKNGKYDWIVPYEVKDKDGNIIATANATYHLRKMG